MTIQIVIPQEKLAVFCRTHAIRTLSLFGSVLRDDFSPDSDIDVLVEFEPGASITYFDLAAIQIELADLLGRAVDLGTPNSLSDYIRDRVLASVQVIYEHQ